MDTAQVLHHEMCVYVYMYTRRAFAYELALGRGRGGKGNGVRNQGERNNRKRTFDRLRKEVCQISCDFLCVP